MIKTEQLSLARQLDMVFKELEEELSGLHTMCTESWKMVTEFIFEKFKKILQDQLQFQHQ